MTIDWKNITLKDLAGSLSEELRKEGIDLILKHFFGNSFLDIGSGPGALAKWLIKKDFFVTCLEPAKEFAAKATKRGLKVHTTTIQNFSSELQYDNILAISSLIHVPKVELPLQINKISKLLKPNGKFFVLFIEGEGEGLEDPTNRGKLRFFAKWKESEIDKLFFSTSYSK